jgi:ABC-type tungstate transport system permease subunit
MDETITKIAGGDNDILSMYFICLAKYALAKGKGVDREELKYNAYLLLAKYCENPGNNYKPKGEVKKLIDAKNQDKLKEFLDSKQKK